MSGVTARRLLATSYRQEVLDHLAPLLDESRSLRLSLFLLVVFTLSFLALAVWFKVLRHYMWHEEPIDKYDDKGNQVKSGLVMKVQMYVFGKSDIELQRLLQSSSSTAGLIFTVVGFVAAYATDGDLARLLLGFVGLGSQVVFLTWIYVESWGEFLNSLILTGTLVTAAFNTLSPVNCRKLSCLERDNSWEPTLITGVFYFILLFALLNVILAAAPLLGLLKVSRQMLLNRVYKTLDSRLSFMVDSAVEESSDKKERFLSDTLVGELVQWCMKEEYLGEMQEKVYRGLKRTELRVVVAALPTLVLSLSAIWLKSSWRWAGAAAVALMAASCSAMLFGFLCARQRENRLPLCFSRGNDIIESFENATADLFGMDRPDFDDATWGVPSFEKSNEGFVTALYDYKRKHGQTLDFDWETCNFMVIQTLGLAELGHFELQSAEWHNVVMDDGTAYNVDPNSNSELRQIQDIPCDVEGLGLRRKLIMYALQLRNPVKIGPTAVSKVAGVMMALKNAIHYMKKHEGHIHLDIY